MKRVALLMPTDCQSTADENRGRQLFKELSGLAEVCVLFAEVHGIDIGITKAQLDELPTVWRATSHCNAV